MQFFTIASVALSVAAGASALSIPHNHVRHARHAAEKPDTYYEGYLEPYQTYHTRYLAIDCDAQHNTTFFDRCCHPMLATETLAKNRDADCNPANHVSTTAASTTSTQVLAPTQSDDDDCDDEPTSTGAAAPTSTGDDDDDSDCEDEPEPTTTATPEPTHPATTAAPSTTSTTTHTTPSTTKTPATTKAPSTPKPSTTSTKAATTTKTSSSPKPTSDGDENTGGNATFFYQGGQAGACGKVNADSAFVAALQTERYGDLGAKSSNCGRRILVTNTKNQKTVEVTVADACPTCGGKNDLDLSEGAFTQIATKEEGEVPITWKFIS